MRENVRLFAKAFRKFLPLVAFVCVLVATVFYVRLSPMNAFASQQIACVKISSAISKGGERDVKYTDFYYLSSFESKAVCPKKDFVSLDANSSLVYIFDIDNITSENINCQLVYNAKQSVNFKVVCALDNEQFDLNSASFEVGANQSRQVSVHVFVDDLTLDAKIDGTVSIIVHSVSGV